MLLFVRADDFPTVLAVECTGWYRGARVEDSDASVLPSLCSVDRLTKLVRWRRVRLEVVVVAGW